jgi:Protein of unknown function (DUF1566)
MNKRITSIACAIGIALTSLSFESHAQTAAAGPYYAVPSWDQTLPAASRFVVLSNFANQAVLDRETGLVWLRTPLSSTNFAHAYEFCVGQAVNGRTGWRLPSASELGSLFDQTATSTQDIPAGHPFILPPNFAFFWSSTLAVSNGANLRFINGYILLNGSYSPQGGSLNETDSGTPWCVRGPGEMGSITP